ncbi:hypothetical protein S2M10_05320 [Sphingomonas sp. S2M10]|jgi:hypothetical protein|uniref:outer membrane protein assembly factor BamE n=1 Tax=Sphingomonas sp. S2M10 TaxID=2705010 RepID=UPI00145793BF|nr:outer membrane protein assembly factor BamE [Sphingomonas sp. S2M10]NLS25564.1 hypothetical protein [Sphingomonas sp. S2M10]
MRARHVLLTVLLLASGCSAGAPFDKARWRDADLSGRTRAEMMPDFLRRHRLIGLTRQQVEAELGPPTTTEKWRGADMVYVLGNDGSMFAIDSEWLLIFLDPNGRVARYRQVAD